MRALTVTHMIPQPFAIPWELFLARQTSSMGYLWCSIKIRFDLSLIPQNCLTEYAQQEKKMEKFMEAAYCRRRNLLKVGMECFGVEYERNAK